MLVVMRQSATPEEIRGVEAAIEARGWKAHPIPGGQRTAIGITGNPGAVEAPVFESLPGVLEVIPVTTPTSSSRVRSRPRAPSCASEA